MFIYIICIYCVRGECVYVCSFTRININPTPRPSFTHSITRTTQQHTPRNEKQTKTQTDPPHPSRHPSIYPIPDVAAHGGDAFRPRGRGHPRLAPTADRVGAEKGEMREMVCLGSVGLRGASLSLAVGRAGGEKARSGEIKWRACRGGMGSVKGRAEGRVGGSYI